MSYNILFYYPRHFNRSNKGPNPFFDPLIEVCKNNGLSYLLVEEPDKGTDKPKNPESIKFDLWLFLILVLRKVVPLKLFKNFEYREQFIGKIIRLVTFNKYQAQSIISLSNSMGGFWRGYNPKARIFDYQHGIIPVSQPGYFENNSATDLMRYNNKEVMVYGEGFRQSFLNVDPDYYLNKVHVVGCNINSTINVTHGNNILVALQIIESEKQPHSWFQDQIDLLYNQFQEFAKSPWAKNRTIYLKHHPRSNRTFDTSRLFEFPFVRIVDNSIESQKIALHITFFSTTAFDYAAQGIPTLFLYSDAIPGGKTLFHDEFDYPYKEISSIIEWFDLLSNKIKSKEITTNMIKWYNNFYTPFNSNFFLELISSNNE